MTYRCVAHRQRPMANRQILRRGDRPVAPTLKFAQSLLLRQPEPGDGFPQTLR